MPRNRRAQPRRRRRRHRFPQFLLLCALFALFLWWSNHSLQTQSFTYSSERLPAGFDGCVIVQISDLHGAEFGDNNQDLLQQVRAAKPDYIFLTGDLQDMYRQTPQSYSVNLGRTLAQIAPTYFVTGNHEWALPDVRGLKRKLQEAGVTVLTNEYVLLERDGCSILLAGIDDPNGFADQKTPEELAEEIQALEGDPFWLLLAHRNNYFEKEYSHLGADLVISGHGHGGLIRLPFTDGLVSVERTLFPTYTAGFYEANGGDLFVSRGLGNSGKTFRLFNRPELVILALRRK
ncbi:MAG: metallophosphoesterase [Oscillospiraceae bacterium]|nr:metallophosphoesterase [Oscillospiraceae bacterium]